jgi:hypothetical protein
MGFSWAGCALHFHPTLSQKLRDVAEAFSPWLNTTLAVYARRRRSQPHGPNASLTRPVRVFPRYFPHWQKMNGLFVGRLLSPLSPLLSLKKEKKELKRAFDLWCGNQPGNATSLHLHDKCPSRSVRMCSK